MTQQYFSQVSPTPARDSDTVVETPVTENAKDGGFLVQTVTGTSLHKIRKIIKNSSVKYFCNECNAHYSQLTWVKEDHPGIDVSNFNICDLRKGRGIYS